MKVVFIGLPTPRDGCTTDGDSPQKPFTLAPHAWPVDMAGVATHHAPMAWWCNHLNNHRMKNYVAIRVVAVPVCRPARPARAHPSLGGAFHGWKHAVCTWKCIIRRWKCNVCGWQHFILDGNVAARTFGRAHRHRPYHSTAHRRSAKVKIKVLTLA